MPYACFVKVREVSSEDSVYLAKNLVNFEAAKKWKTKNVGEKSAYVVLEMKESHQIVGIDIGNEHSAFIQVLVGKSDGAPEEFKEILLTCSFMTPLESKSSNNINRVRCFSKEALVPIVVSKKWSLVKIVCTQPFNKHVQYGLSFIKLYVQENQKPEKIKHRFLESDQFVSVVGCKKANTDEFVNNATKLKFREDSSDSEIDNSKSLFSRWKKFKGAEKSSPTNIIKETLFLQRLGDAQSTYNSQSDKAVSSIRDRNRKDLAIGEENFINISNQDNLERLSIHITDGKEADKMAKNKGKSQEDKRLEISSSCKKNNSTDDTSAKLKRTENRESLPSKNKVKKVQTTQCALFNHLLKGVVFVISGIQNPERGDLRNKALAMGAKYKADWDSSCTHLICAFKNTPKYKQVRGKGKIVSPSWINKCYSLKKYLPWRRYALDNNELDKPESDEEITFVPLEYVTNEISSDKGMQLSASIIEHTLASESNSRRDTLGTNNIDDRQKITPMMSGEVFSDCDTDDEIKRVERSLENNVYATSTDEEDYLIRRKYNKL